MEIADRLNAIRDVSSPGGASGTSIRSCTERCGSFPGKALVGVRRYSRAGEFAPNTAEQPAKTKGTRLGNNRREKRPASHVIVAGNPPGGLRTATAPDHARQRTQIGSTPR